MCLAVLATLIPFVQGTKIKGVPWPLEPVGLAAGMAVSKQGILYTISPEDGIQAINLENGTVRWRSGTSEWPIDVVDSTLIALSGSKGLRVVGLDASTGAVRFEKPFGPKGLQANFNLHSRLRSGATSVRLANGGVLIAWVVASGEASPAALQLPPPMPYTGYVVVDAITGDTTEISTLSSSERALLDAQRPAGIKLPYSFSETNLSQPVVLYETVVQGKRLQVMGAPAHRNNIMSDLRIRRVSNDRSLVIWNLKFARATYLLPMP